MGTGVRGTGAGERGHDDWPYDHAVLAVLPRFGALLAVLYGTRAIPYGIVYEGDLGRQLVGISLAAGLYFLALSWLCGSHRIPPTKWQHAVGLLVLALCAETAARVALTGQAWQCLDLALIVIGAATLTSKRWFVVAVAAAWAGIIASFVLSLPIDDGDGGGLVWPYLGIAMGSSTALSGFFRSSRVAAFRSLNEARESAEDAAVRDALTGLANRRGLHLAARLLEGSADASGLRVHGLFVDVDAFKTVNDTAGHDTGDQVLVSVAEALQACAPDHVVARWAGDEFVVVGVGTGPTPAELEERVAAHLAAESDLVPDVWPGRISAGHATCVVDRTFDVDALLRDADQDMYRRRAQRRGATGRRSTDEPAALVRD